MQGSKRSETVVVSSMNAGAVQLAVFILAGGKEEP